MHFLMKIIFLLLKYYKNMELIVLKLPNEGK